MNNLRQENIYNLNLFDDDVSVNEVTIIKSNLSKNNEKKYYFKVSEHDDYRKCETCNTKYIWKTERILIHRKKEHSKNTNSACYQHIKDNPGHRIDYNNIKVIDRADSDFKLRIKDLLHILNSKPEFKQLNSKSSKYEIKTLVIQGYEQHQSK